jgi:DNA-binding XRE family transcriptional regulator
MMNDTSNVEVVTLEGKRFVILPETEFHDLLRAQLGPDLPPADKAGNRPAIEAMRAVIARNLARDRTQLGWSQAELARRAGIRVETLHRIETGKHTPSITTMHRIEAAFRTAEESGRSQPKAKQRHRKRAS